MPDTTMDNDGKLSQSSDSSYQAGEPDVFRDTQKHLIDRLNTLWDQRGLLLRVSAIGLLIAILIAFLIPKRYISTTQLMPPDSESTTSMMMLAGLAQKTGSGLGAMAGDLLGIKSSGALFVGVL